jgi:hypothetical protein
MTPLETNSAKRRLRGLALDFALAAGLAGLTLLLRVLWLSEQSVWYDEYLSVRSVHLPSLVACLREQLKWDWHMVPAYHVVQYYWAHCTGGSDLAIRWLSVLYSAGAVVLLFALGRSCFNRTAAVAAVACFALSPFHLFHGQEIRQYSMVTFLALLSLFTFLKMEKDWSLRWGALHVACNLLLLWTHLLSAFLLVPEGLYLLLFHFRSWRKVLGWFVAHAAIVLSLVVWVLSLRGGAGAPGATPPPLSELWQVLFHRDFEYIHWAAGAMPIPVHPGEAAPLALRLLLYQPRMENLLARVWVFSIAVAVVFAVWRWRRAGERDRFKAVVLFALVALVPPVLLFATTWAAHLQLFQGRFSIYSSPALYLVAGAAVGYVKPRWLRAGCLLFLVGMMGFQTVFGVGLRVRHGYLPAARMLREHKQPEEFLVVHGLYTQWLLEYNLGPPPIPRLDTSTTEELERTLLERLGQGQRGWLVMPGMPPNNAGDPNLAGAAERVEGFLREHGLHYEMTRFLGMQNIHVFHVFPSSRDSVEDTAPGTEAAPGG